MHTAKEGAYVYITYICRCLPRGATLLEVSARYDMFLMVPIEAPSPLDHSQREALIVWYIYGMYLITVLLALTYVHVHQIK